jgi:hypothetical protein
LIANAATSGQQPSLSLAQRLSGHWPFGRANDSAPLNRKCVNILTPAAQDAALNAGHAYDLRVDPVLRDHQKIINAMQDAHVPPELQVCEPPAYL